MSTPPSVLAMTIGRRRRAIEEDGEVELPRDVDRLADKHLADLLALRAGLMRHQYLAEAFWRRDRGPAAACRKDGRHP